MAHEEAQFIRGPVPFPSAPTVTVYSPATTSYAKVTPSANTLKTMVRPRTITQSLVYAATIVHKIADGTTITSAAPTDDNTDRARATEFKNDFNTHVASTAYHVAAGTAIATADAISDPTLIALCQAIDAAMKAHAASTTEHGGMTDTVFVAALVAAALPAIPTKGECRTWLADAVLKAAWTAHLAVTDLGAYVTAGPVGLPIEWPCSAPFYAKTDTSAGVFTVTEWTGW
jgi:hypothetical protein